MDKDCPKQQKQSELNRWLVKQQEARKREFQTEVSAMVTAIQGVTVTQDQLDQMYQWTQAAIARDELATLGDSPHIQSNWGQFHNNPNIVLGIVEICKVVGLAELLEDTLQTNVRYGSRYINTHHKTYLEDHPKLDKTLAAAGGLHFVLSLLFTAQAVKTTLTAEESVYSFNAISLLTTRLADLGGDIVSKLDDWRLLPSMRGYINYKHFGSWAVAFSLVEGVAENAAQARSWFDPNIPLNFKIIGTTQAGLGTLGDLMDVLAMKVIIDRAEKIADSAGSGAAAGIKKAVNKKLGALLIASAIFELAAIPLELASMQLQREYANENDQLDRRYSTYGYQGYGMLRDYYHDKAEFDRVFFGLRKCLQVVHVGSSLALKFSVVGIKLGLAVDAVAMVLSTILDVIEQPLLENIAQKQYEKILAWETANPGKNFFASGLEAHYQDVLPQIAELAKNIQNIWDVDRVVMVTQMLHTPQTRELATLVGRNEDVSNGELRATVFNKGVEISQKDVQIDASKGMIEITQHNLKQALAFSNPILVAGTVKHEVVEDEPYSPPFIPDEYSFGLATVYPVPTYKEELTVHAKDWVINDKGTASTQVDLNQLVQRLRNQDNVLKTIKVNANMGDGDDVVLANLGRLVINGGEGYDIVDYSHAAKKEKSGFSIKVTATQAQPGSYQVIKTLTNITVFEESIATQKVASGRKVDKVLYRKVEEKVITETVTDELSAVEKLVGSNGADVMSATTATWGVYFDGAGGNDVLTTGSGNDTVRGGKGDDIVKTGAGDDTILQDIYSNENDQICGGDGEDMANYSITPHDSKNNLYIKVDLKKETVKKYINGVLAGQDTLRKVEHVTATAGNDDIHMDDKANIVYALNGNDLIKTFGGNDLVIAGLGDDVVDAGDGDDYIYQHMEQDQDNLDGGAGNDTVSYYGMTTFKDGHRDSGTWHMDKIGVQVDLKARKAIKFTNGEKVVHLENAEQAALTYVQGYRAQIVDTLKNIENIDGTDLNDTLLGDEGDNHLRAFSGDNKINSRGGNDTIEVGDGNNTIYAASGNNKVFVGNGNNRITVGDGDNIIRIGNGQNTIKTGAGKNRIEMQDGNNTIEMGVGDELVYLGSGSNKLNMGAGDDAIILKKISSWNNELDGGAGFDIVNYSALTMTGNAASQGIYVDLAAGYATTIEPSTSHDKLQNIEAIIGTQYADMLYGDDEDNLLDGWLGTDTMNGRGGNDKLYGGTDNNYYVFTAAHGHDEVYDKGGSSDLIQLTALAEDNYRVERSGQNLTLRHKNETDSVTVLGQFSASDKTIEWLRVEADEGGEVKDYDLSKLVEYAANFQASQQGAVDVWSFSLRELVTGISITPPA